MDFVRPRPPSLSQLLERRALGVALGVPSQLLERSAVRPRPPSLSQLLERQALGAALGVPSQLLERSTLRVICTNVGRGL